MTMSGLENVALFYFVATATLAVFAFMSVAHWVSSRTKERMARERYALLRKVAEQPTDTARLVLEKLREDDARLEERALRREAKMRRDERLGGTIMLAIGFGLSIFLYAVAPEAGVWTIGIMIVLIGIVMLAFTARRPSDAKRELVRSNGG
jgi:Flp pilus assembly protein TadB